MYWSYHTSAGEIRIVEKTPDCFYVLFNSEKSYCFNSPEKAAHAVRSFTSNCSSWDCLFGNVDPIPNELNEWNRHY